MPRGLPAKTEWTLEVPTECGGREDNVFANSLLNIASLFRPRCGSGSLAGKAASNNMRLIIIPSECGRALLRCILMSAYGPEDPVHERYLLVDTGVKPDYFDAIGRVFTDLNLGAVAPIWGIAPAVVSILGSEQSVVSAAHLRQTIERSCFPSGAEELQEMYYRDATRLHDIFGIVRRSKDEYKDYFPAIRLLLGAFTAGDVGRESVLNTLVALNGEQGAWAETKAWLTNVDTDRSTLKLARKCVCRLADYFAGRRILVIEDGLHSQHWGHVLPQIFGAETEIRANGVTTLAKGLEITHAENIASASEKYDTTLSMYDVVLLDLFSSDKRLIEGDRHSAALSMASVPLTQFMASAQLPANAPQNSIVPTSIAQVIVFSAHNSGIACRTMLKDMGVVDYFFKTPYSEPHKSAYYATFRNALLTAVRENIVHVLSLPRSGGNRDLARWLTQFLPADRPTILRIMKHFRYYPAMSIVRVFDQWLKVNASYAEDVKRNAVNVSVSSSKSVGSDSLWFSYLGHANKSGPTALALIGKTEWVKEANDLIRSASAKRTNGGDDKPPLLRFITYDDLKVTVVDEMSGRPNICKREVCIVLVDDVIGSGGQLTSYLWGFVHSVIHELREEECARRCVIGGWEVNQSAGIKTDETKEGLSIQIHVLCAIGIGIASVAHDVKKSSVLGYHEVPACVDSSHKRVENCTCTGRVRFMLHIADHTANLWEILKAEAITSQSVREMLKQYALITNPRLNEVPCEFEPAGWKDDGGLIATYANTPGNTLPIIWGCDGDTEWYPLFRRFFNPWSDGERQSLLCENDPAKCVLVPGKGCSRLGIRNRR